MVFSLKIKLNCSWNFWWNWNVPLVLLERSWWARFDGIYLVRFGLRMWEILIIKWFLSLKIQINFKKPGFERKKISWERGNTWRLTIQFKHDFLSYLAIKKINTLQNNVHMLSFLFYNGFTLRPMTQATLMNMNK
jgi:hypothetical protein